MNNSDFGLKSLDYGVIGFCAIMLIATYRIIYVEQKRGTNIRKGIIKFSSIFMVFCLLLAGINAYVQLGEGNNLKRATVHAVVFIK